MISSFVIFHCTTNVQGGRVVRSHTTPVQQITTILLSYFRVVGDQYDNAGYEKTATAVVTSNVQTSSTHKTPEKPIESIGGRADYTLA